MPVYKKGTHTNINEINRKMEWCQVNTPGNTGLIYARLNSDQLHFVVFRGNTTGNLTQSLVCSTLLNYLLDTVLFS